MKFIFFLKQRHTRKPKGRYFAFKYNDIGSFENLIKNNHDIGIILWKFKEMKSQKINF